MTSQLVLVVAVFKWTFEILNWKKYFRYDFFYYDIIDDVAINML